MSEREYTVRIACNFDAVSPSDAVRQMAGWLLDDGALHGGYRVEWDDNSVFIDADDMGLQLWEMSDD